MQHTTRLLAAPDLPRYRSLRLQALTECPTAFGASPASDQALSDAQVLSCFGGPAAQADQAMWGSFDHKGELCATLGFYRDQGDKMAHKGHLFAMYVAAQSRGLGLARALLTAAFAHGQSLGLRQLLLSCNASNGSALHLYEQSGFRPYGLEPAALCIAGEFFDEVLMVREFKPRPAFTPSLMASAPSPVQPDAR